MKNKKFSCNCQPLCILKAFHFHQWQPQGTRGYWSNATSTGWINGFFSWKYKYFNVRSPNLQTIKQPWTASNPIYPSSLDISWDSAWWSNNKPRNYNLTLKRIHYQAYPDTIILLRILYFHCHYSTRTFLSLGFFSF